MEWLPLRLRRHGWIESYYYKLEQLYIGGGGGGGNPLNYGEYKKSAIGGLILGGLRGLNNQRFLV